MMVRPAGFGDLSAIVRIHVQAFDGFFLTQLGRLFLWEYYAAVCRYDRGILLVASSSASAAIEGFVAGFIDPPAFYRHLQCRRLRLAFAALPALVRRPFLLRRILSDARQVNQNGSQGASACESELASLAVIPSAQRTGLGKTLAHAFLSQSEELGATRVTLTTDADANDKVNRFYQSLGFQVIGAFNRGKHRRMHRYDHKLATHYGHGNIRPQRRAKEKANNSEEVL